MVHPPGGCWLLYRKAEPVMNAEGCTECGFDGDAWSDAKALEQVALLPELWAQAISGIAPSDVSRRPIGGMWSIAEYTDHVRETTFGMRFVLAMALQEPGVSLGDPPEPRFDPEPRQIDIAGALAAFSREVQALTAALTAAAGRWESSAVVGGNEVDIHWVVRHALHDVIHHLGDVRHLRDALSETHG